MKITVIRQERQSALVEWHDGERMARAIVPAASVSGDEVSAQTLKHGVPWGVPWEDVLSIDVTPQAIADELRRRGIWTAGDLAARPQEAVAALQRVYAVSLAALRKAAEEVEKGRL